jgi:CelD/BcsL family acetyltransferase involved in cellulose biosynthesis
LKDPALIIAKRVAEAYDWLGCDQAAEAQTMIIQGSQALLEIDAPTRRVFVSATALQVELLTTEAEFDSLQTAWDQLLAESDQRVFFLCWSWNRLWWQTYAPPESRLFLLACRDAEGKLLGLAPLYWQQRCWVGVPHIRDLNFLGTGTGIKTSEHLDMFTRRGFERACAEAFAAFLLQRRDWDRLWFWNIPDCSKVLPHFQRALGEPARASVCDQLYYVATDTDWATIKRDWSRQVSRTLERRMHKLYQDYAVEFHQVKMQDELEPALDHFVRLHQLRWTAKGESGSFAYPKFEAFLRTAASQALSEGRLGFWMLKLNGQCAATLLAFVDNGVAHYFQGGFDISYAKYSLGSVMMAHCIQTCVADSEIRAFDLMGGGAAYKDSWTKNARDAYELELFRQSWRALLYQTGIKTRRVLGRVWRALRARFRPAAQQTA